MSSEKEFFETIEKAVFRQPCFARKQENADALYRLLNHPDAKMAWLALSKKKLRKSVSFYEVASMIGSHAATAYLDHTAKRTAREIQDAARNAADLAKTLKATIERNATLRNIGEDLLPPAAKAAFSRLLRGIIFTAEIKTDQPDRWFSSEIEKELDELQARDYPEFSNMTTSEAYRAVNWITISDDFFLAMLETFIKRAFESSDFNPVVPRPNLPSADQHAFSINVCHSLLFYYGSPNLGIVSSFSSAVFNQPVAPETVKKWWARKGDNS